MTSAAEFQAKVTKAATNMDRLDGVVNGGVGVEVTTDNGVVPSLAKLLHDIAEDASPIALDDISDIDATGAAALIGAIGGTLQANLNARTVVIATRTAMTALSLSGSTTAHLTEAGREGLFAYTTGDYSARITGDSLQGLYVPANGDPTGATGCWVRQWDGTVGRPEWFGATVDNSGFNCLPALEACYALCPTSQGSVGTYYITDTFQMLLDNKTWRGVGKSWIGYTANTTAIKLTGSNATTKDVVQIGGDLTDPPHAAYDDFCAEPRFFDCDVTRSLPAVCTENRAESPTGVRVLFTHHAHLENINSTESPIGFYWGANVYTKSARLTYRKSVANAAGTYDFAMGYFVDGNYLVGTYYPGGNASLYFDFFKSQIEAQPADLSLGMAITGGFSDTFLNDFETIGCRDGVLVEGSKDLEDVSAPSQSGASMGRNNDLHMTRLVLDGCSGNGLEVRKLVRYATVEVNDIYATCATSATAKAFYLHDGNGSITVTGGHVYGWPIAGSTGVDILDQSGVWLQGLTLVGCTKPVIADNAFSPRIQVKIINPYEAIDAAIDCTDVTNGVIESHLTGGPTTACANKAVRLNGTGCTNTEVNASGIDPSTCFDGKLFYNGTQVTARGAFGTGNYYTGAGI